MDDDGDLGSARVRRHNAILSWGGNAVAKPFSVQAHGPELSPQNPCAKLGMLLHTYNSSTVEAETRGSLGLLTGWPIVNLTSSRYR